MLRYMNCSTMHRWLRPHQRAGVQFMFECVFGLRNFKGMFGFIGKCTNDILPANALFHSAKIILGMSQATAAFWRFVYFFVFFFRDTTCLVLHDLICQNLSNAHQNTNAHCHRVCCDKFCTCPPRTTRALLQSG